MSSTFTRSIHQALLTDHAHLAMNAGGACKYIADVAPFASVGDDPSPETLAALHSLLTADEEVWLCPAAPLISVTGLLHCQTLPCLQMLFPDSAQPPAATLHPQPLNCADAPAMVALTTRAYPGFFRPRTCLMGCYFGFWADGQLVAMGGERLNFTADGQSYREISGLCTHPDHRGRGYALALLAHLVTLHRLTGQRSWLQVAAANPAQHLYHRLGFETVAAISLQRLRRMEVSGR